MKVCSSMLQKENSSHSYKQQREAKEQNALFKKGVGAQFSMTSFLREYQRIVTVIHANEDELDHNAAKKDSTTNQVLY